MQTWHLLPSPAVLYLVQHAEGALRDRLSSAALALRRVSAQFDPVPLHGALWMQRGGRL